MINKYFELENGFRILLKLLQAAARFIFPAVLFMLSGNSAAQQNLRRFDHLSINEGLSQSVATCIFRDKQGFMWFGTQDGLNRYDGYDFTVYKSIPFDSSSLTNNWIQAIAEDETGSLWVGTYSGGLFKFDKAKQSFTHYGHEQNDINSVANNRIWAVVPDTGGIIWIGSSSGLDKYDQKKGIFIHLNSLRKDLNLSKNPAVNFIYKDERGNLWLGTWGDGLIKYNKKDGTFRRYTLDSKGKGETGNRFIKAIAGDSGNILLGTSRGLLSFDTASGAYEKIRLNKSDPNISEELSVMSLMKDTQGNLWVGTHHHGLFIMNAGSRKITKYTHNAEDPNSLSDNWISSIYQDTEGMIWLGTGKGIDRNSPYTEYFTNYRNDPRDHNSLSADEVNALYEDKEKTIWVGTWGGGLNEFNAATGKFITYRKTESSGSSIPSDIVWSVTEDRKGKLWIGTYSGIVIFNKKDHRFEYPPEKLKLLSNLNISSILDDGAGNIWIGTWGGGLYRYNQAMGELKRFAYNSQEKGTISDDIITSLYLDRKNNLWVGTNAGGLNLYDSARQMFVNYKYNPRKPGSISSSCITSIFEDDKENLWIGTWGGGLNLFDQSKNMFVNYTEREGLVNNIVHGILQDGNGNLWISTSDGISRFNIKSRMFVNYDNKDGLGNNQFTQGFIKCSSGVIMFGGTSGITAFNPDCIKLNNHVPNTVITSFEIFNKEAKFDKRLKDIGEIRLEYYEHDFSIEFTALEYTRTDKCRYAYILEGYDKGWINSGNRRKAYYTNMDPGEYVFKVKASNGDNLWTSNATILRIRIVPPFWKTWPFIFFVMFVLSTIVYLVHKYRLEQMLKFERMRSTIAVDLHDDIGASLTRISVFSDAAVRVLQKECETEQNGKKYDKIISLLKEIGMNSRDLIGSMSDIVWTVNPQNDSFDNITLRMKDNMAQLMSANEIDYDVKIDPGLSELTLPMDFRRNMYLIYKEALNNTVRHASATKVFFSIRKENDMIVLTFEDNGWGFDTANNYSGNGLTNIRKRTAAFGGDLSIDSVNGKGTKLKVRLKLP